MAKYHIYTGEQDKGFYTAECAEAALNEFAQEKGYQNWDEAAELNAAQAIIDGTEAPSEIDKMIAKALEKTDDEDRIVIKIDKDIQDFGGDFICYKHDENWNILAALYQTSFVTGDKYFLLAEGQPRQFISAEEAAEIERKNL